MSERANYSSDELAAFSLVDLMRGGEQVDLATVADLLGKLASESERTRWLLDRAMWGLLETSKAKRANLHAVLSK